MVREKQAISIEADLLEAERWFVKTYDSEMASTEKIQMLILYRISNVEKALEEIRHQTSMHWTN